MMKRSGIYGNVKGNFFFMKGFITAMVIAVLTKVIVWANYHRLLVSSEEMERQNGIGSAH